MAEFLTYEISDGIATITLDDGKVNVMSPAMLRAILDAFDRAEKDEAVVLLTGRPGMFSAGFDLGVFQQGQKATLEMLRAGGELVERVLGFPSPVVAACTGHAYPMGAFLLLAADMRLGTRGDFRIGLNEVAIGLTLPLFAVEIARQRLTPAYFNRATLTGELFSPDEARIAGFLDHVVSAEELPEKSRSAAITLTGINRKAHRETKERVRSASLAALRAAIDEELR